MILHQSTTILLWVVLGLISSSTTAAVTLAPHIPRGGAHWFGLFQLDRPSASQRYRTSLEEQIGLLERKLRTAKDEANQLRRLLKLQIETSRKQTSFTTIRNDRENLQLELSLLLSQMEHLVKLQKDLETLLKEEQERTAELEKDLLDEKANAMELVKKHDTDIKELQKILDTKMQVQLKDLQKVMDAKIKEATINATKEALKLVDEKVNEAMDSVQTKAEKVLEQERLKGEAAVERERVKMRKLVKALAEREKKLVTNHEQQQQQQQQQQQRGTVISNKSSLESSIKQTGTTSVRPPFK